MRKCIVCKKEIKEPVLKPYLITNQWGEEGTTFCSDECMDLCVEGFKTSYQKDTGNKWEDSTFHKYYLELCEKRLNKIVFLLSSMLILAYLTPIYWYDIRLLTDSWTLSPIIFGVFIMFAFSRSYPFSFLKLEKNIKEHKTKFILGALLIACFYWFEIRPSQTRKKCAKQSYRYIDCLRENGLGK